MAYEQQPAGAASRPLIPSEPDAVAWQQTTAAAAAARAGVMARAGALVLPSRYDPWPLIVVEGAAAGLPLLVSEACGSVVEILRPHYNGLTIPSHVCAEQLAEAMTRISSESDLVSWGERSRALAEPYAARFWADRWLKVLSRSVPATYDPNCKKLR